MELQQYEFSRSQNELITQLADKMRFVSYFFMVMGVLNAIAGVIGLFTASIGSGIGDIITGVVLIIIGIWTKKAASSFQLIVNTQGNDIENLMGALGELRKFYALQYWLLIVALIFTAIALVMALLLVVFATPR